MGIAFPGVRELAEFTNRRKIIKKISVLLQPPLNFEYGLENVDVAPVWYSWIGAAEKISFLTNKP